MQMCRNRDTRRAEARMRKPDDMDVDHVRDPPTTTPMKAPLQPGYVQGMVNQWEEWGWQGMPQEQSWGGPEGEEGDGNGGM